LSKKENNGEPAQAEASPIYIGNAGMVLLSPFLHRAFEMLDLLNEGSFVNNTAACRAALFLQYLVTGDEQYTNAQLALNKILCGLPVEQILADNVTFTEQEKAVATQMLQAVIVNWPVISNTSIAGLRETFLQREGRITVNEERYTLRIQRKTLDVLVDKVPWSFSVARAGWMNKAVYTTW
jgi:Contractile injection system tape measure protein